MLPRLTGYFSPSTTNRASSPPPVQMQPGLGQSDQVDQLVLSRATVASANVTRPHSTVEQAGLNEPLCEETIRTISLSYTANDIRTSFRDGADKSGKTPLHWAAQSGNVDVVRQLLENVDLESINRPDKSGKTPLHWAAQSGSTAVVKLLLENAALASINKADGLRKTPLHYAAEYCSADAVDLVLRHGGSQCINQPDDMRSSPLHWYIIRCPEGKERDGILALLRHGADPTLMPKYLTREHKALLAEGCQTVLDETIEAIRHGADPTLMPEYIKREHKALLAKVCKPILDEKMEALQQTGLSKNEKRNLLNQIGRLWRCASLKDFELGKLARIAVEAGHVEAVKAFYEGSKDHREFGLALAGVEGQLVNKARLLPDSK